MVLLPFNPSNPLRSVSADPDDTNIGERGMAAYLKQFRTILKTAIDRNEMVVPELVATLAYGAPAR